MRVVIDVGTLRLLVKDVILAVIIRASLEGLDNCDLVPFGITSASCRTGLAIVCR